MPKQTFAPIIALLAAVIIWGYNFIVVKQLLVNIAPYTIGFYVISGAAIILSIIFGRGLLRYKTSLIITSCISGFFGIFLFNACLYYGLTKTTAINASLIISTTPCFSSLVNIFYFKNKIKIIDIFSMLLSILGVFLLITGGRLSNLDYTGIQGDIVIIFAVIAFVIYISFGNVVMQKMQATHYTTWCFICSSVCMFFLSLFCGNIMGYQNLHHLSDWIYIFYGIIFTSIFANIAYNYGINRTNIIIPTIFTNSTPIFTTFFSVAFYGESLTTIKIIAGVLVLTGVSLPVIWQIKQQQFSK